MLFASIAAFDASGVAGGIVQEADEMRAEHARMLFKEVEGKEVAQVMQREDPLLLRPLIGVETEEPWSCQC